MLRCEIIKRFFIRFRSSRRACYGWLLTVEAGGGTTDFHPAPAAHRKVAPMAVLRATLKLLKSLPDCSAELPDTPINALGDWYANRVVVHRRPVILLVSSTSLLAILAPAREVKTLPGRLPQLVRERLRRLPVGENIVAAEVEAMGQVLVGKTSDRSLRRRLVEFAGALPDYLPADEWQGSDLRTAEDCLAETPCQTSRTGDEVIWPEKAAVRLLLGTWPAQTTRH